LLDLLTQVEIKVLLDQSDLLGLLESQLTEEILDHPDLLEKLVELELLEKEDWQDLQDYKDSLALKVQYMASCLM